MEFQPPPENVPVRSVLERLGFVVDAASWADALPGLKYDFGNFELTAGEYSNLSRKRTFNFSGVMSDRRTLRQVDFSMPIIVESAVQAIAWIVFGVGVRFTPATPTAWFEEGKSALEESLHSGPG